MARIWDQDGQKDIDLVEYLNETGASGLTLISRQVLAASASTVTFSAVPQTFENLILEIVARIDEAVANDSITLRFNGDSGASYDFEEIFAKGSTVGGFGALAATSATVGFVPGSSAPANQPSFTRIKVGSYARTVFNKVTNSQSSLFDGAGASTNCWSFSVAGNWRSTAAINEITLSPGGGNFVTGSVFSVYGEL